MMQHEISSKMNTKRVRNISYDMNNILGSGYFAIVFHGSLQLNQNSESNLNNDELLEVPVKRLQIGQQEANVIQREIEMMKIGSNHPNILRYICTDKDDFFVYIVTELCRGTLEDYVKGINYEGPRFQNEKEILWQATQGLAHLHRKGIVHRDIKPTNILIFVRGQGSETEVAQIKLADFGISKALNTDREDYTNTSVTNPSGTKGWMAPEVYIDKQFDTKVDIFALGLVFGYTLSEGNKHPFGDGPDDWLMRIKKKKPMKMRRNELKKPYLDDDQAFHLIKSMLVMNPKERPAVQYIVDSLFFPANRQTLFESICNSLKNDSFNPKYGVLFGKLLADDSIDANVKLESGFTPLHILCEFYGNNNLIDAVHVFVKEKRVNVNTKNTHGNTPLHSLCNNYKNDNLMEIARLLVDEGGAEVSTKNANDWTPLHALCCYYKNDNLVDIVQLLIKNAADVNAKSKEGYTPLIILCNRYNNKNLKKIVELMLQNKADVNIMCERNGMTPLHELCSQYNKDNLKDIVQLLIEKGAEVNTRNEDGCTPLHVLCQNYKNDNLIDIIQLLLEKGADVNARDDRIENTPLHCLCYSYKNDNLLNIVQFLIENGVVVKAENRNRWTVLHSLCCNYKNDNLKEIVLLLIKDCADVNAIDNNGNTALHELCRNYKNDNLIDIVQLLVEKDADVNVNNANECTPFHLLCSNYINDNLIDVIHFLVKSGADVKAQNQNRWTPLHCLCLNYTNDNLMEIAQLLIKSGAKANAKDGEGDTPLHNLCRAYTNNNLIDIAQFLMQEGTRADAKNKNGEIPLHLLCRYYKIDDGIKGEDNLKRLVILFEKYGASMNVKDAKGTTPNDYLIDRKKTLLAMESTNGELSVAADVPKDHIAKDVYTTAEKSIVTRALSTATKCFLNLEKCGCVEALKQHTVGTEPLEYPGSAHGGFARPTRTDSNYPIYNMHSQHSSAIPTGVSNFAPTQHQLAEAFIVPGTNERPLLNPVPIVAQQPNLLVVDISTPWQPPEQTVYYPSSLYNEYFAFSQPPSFFISRPGPAVGSTWGVRPSATYYDHSSYSSNNSYQEQIGTQAPNTQYYGSGGWTPYSQPMINHSIDGMGINYSQPPPSDTTSTQPHYEFGRDPSYYPGN